MSSSKSFAGLGVSEPVVKALRKRGIEAPFPIQSQVIEDVLDGDDVLVQSPTGSGKTLAFGVPLADLVGASDRRPAALILAPTRELASQIVDEMESICRARALSIAAVYGGVGLQAQAKRAARAHIIVTCPGRLEDQLQRGAFGLGRVRYLVLDEADRMLDMGFKPAVDRIVKKLPPERQTLFFSATLEGAAGEQARAYTIDPRIHINRPRVEDRGRIEHRFVRVSHEAKVDTLIGQLEGMERGRTLVFVRTKHGADRLVRKLSRRSTVNAAAMHGNKSQNQRQRALADFERGKVDTLIATDVAARGIDVADVTHVVNFDAPPDRDTFVHRVGRTARAGSTGVGISFVMSDQAPEMRKIARSLGLGREFDAAGIPMDRPAAGRGDPESSRNAGRRRRNGNRPRNGRGSGSDGRAGMGGGPESGNRSRTRKRRKNG